MIQIKDLNKENLPFVAICGEPEGYFPFGTKKRREFLEKWLDKGILAKIAFRNDEPMGFIEYSPDKVILEDYDTNTREEIEKFGIANGIYLNGKLSFWGRPPGEDEVRATFKEELKKIHEE